MREAIIDTSLQQFLKHGIRKMTVQKLIAPLGISTKTVYKYFTDKEDLLKHCLLKHYSELSAQFDKLEDEYPNPVSAMFHIWHTAIEMDLGVNHIFYHDLNYYYPKLQDSVLHKFFKNNISLLEKLIEDGIKQGYFRAELIPGVVQVVINTLYSSITRTGQFKKFKLTTTSIMENTIDAYLRGICTAKGSRELEKIIHS